MKLFLSWVAPVVLGVCFVVPAGAAASGADMPLAAEQWKTRPLVVVVPRAGDAALGRLVADLQRREVRDAFNERRMVLFTVVAGVGARDGVGLSAGQTAGVLRGVGLGGVDGRGGGVFLVGLDGGVKRAFLGRDGLDGFALAEVFEEIDRMPMRQR